MPLDPLESGITAKHADAIAAACVALDIFVFIRPSEAETMRLIDAEFATKSMDIHDKSSNWGPMAGTVPLDPAFCKKHVTYKAPLAHTSLVAFAQKVMQSCGVRDCGSPHHHCAVARHGVERPTQLIISNKVLKTWIELEKVRAETPSQAPTTSPRTYLAVIPPSARAVDDSMPATTKFILESFTMPDEVLTKWQLPVDLDHRTFWKVSYQHSGTTRPLFVWAYPVEDCPERWLGDTWSHVLGASTYTWPWKTLRPVTGDYDLWMVAPHLCWWKLHAHVVKFTDHHGVPSAATFFNNWLLHQLNVACERVANPVFNHGAEEQNYGFTQALDKKIVMFTSGGNSRMVPMEDMPRVTAELIHAGYLCLWNKRYDEVTPALGGVGFQSLVDAYQRARTELGALVDAGPPVLAGRMPADALRYPQDLAGWQDEKVRKRAALDAAVAALQERHVEYARISNFAVDVVHEDGVLKAARAATAPAHPGLVKLKTGDFSSRHPKVIGEANPLRVADGILAMQSTLQRKLMDFTDARGGGESRVDALEAWWGSDEGIGIAYTLSELVAPAPVASASIDFIPVAVAEAKDTFQIRLRAPKPPPPPR